MKRWLHRLYLFLLGFKALDGVIETLGGLLFLAAAPELLQQWVRTITSPLLAVDPDDLVAHGLRRAFSHLRGGTKIFAGAYLLGHGLIKCGLVAALFRRKRWAFAAAESALGMFVVYQIWRWTHTHAPLLAALAGTDVLIAGLVWTEYRREWPARRHRRRAKPASGARAEGR